MRFGSIALVFSSGLLFASIGFTEEDVQDFSHMVHLEAESDCSVCHDTSGDKPVLQTDSCEGCHEDGTPKWQLADKAVRLKVPLPHKVHAEKVACKECHQARMEDEQQPGQRVLACCSCFVCHEKKKVGFGERQCKRCHGLDVSRQLPDDHKDVTSWSTIHGRQARWVNLAHHGRDCSLCHSSESCQSCHRTSRPQNHSGLWRLRTHGMMAAADRDNCKTCHETGQCVRCHKTTAPQNHVGAWMATHGLVAETRSSQHCAVCHNPGWCAACHAGRRGR